MPTSAALPEWLKGHSTIDVVLDDNPELLQAKNAPDAALYLGWYSLRNYQPTAMGQGAVGFHLASNEMFTLHDADEHGWVVNLLNEASAAPSVPPTNPTSPPSPRLRSFSRSCSRASSPREGSRGHQPHAQLAHRLRR